MAAETATEFADLVRQAQTLMKVFADAGYEAVSPAVIQPAHIFLDVVGESLRARTYVFTDAEGDELCLRPDLTVPTCRLHLSRDPEGKTRAKYCYDGVAFRFQPSGATRSHPREFRQAGIETFADDDRETSEATTVATIIEALRSAGLSEFKLRVGDLGLFSAVLDAAQMPERWRQRLMHQFWRPEAFRNELQRLSVDQPVALKDLPEDLMGALRTDAPQEAEGRVIEYLTTNGIDVVGARSISEVTASLLSMLEDAQAEPLSREAAELIESYIGVNAPARAAGARLRDLARDRKIDISEALDVFYNRLNLLTEAGVDVVHADFSAEFGRTLEYYTGFVFEIIAPALGPQSPIAGGGRYDHLLRAAGAKEDIPAVGGAIHTERLRVAVKNGAA